MRNAIQTVERVQDMRGAVEVIRRGLDRIEADINIEAARTIQPVRHTEYSYGGERVRQAVDRDPTKLLPPFAAKVEELFRAIRARPQGFDPFLWEGFRSFERAERLAKRGTGIVKSMHCYGAAVDIVDSDDTPWAAPDGFWEAVEEEAIALKLHVLYGKDGKRRDRPHVQAVPQAPHIQDAFREMTRAKRIEFLEDQWSV